MRLSTNVKSPEILYVDDSPDDQFLAVEAVEATGRDNDCLLYTSPSPRDRTRSRMPSSA